LERSACGIWNIAREIATHLSGARNDKREVAQNDKRRKLTIIGSARLRMAERACFGLTMRSIIDYLYL